MWLVTILHGPRAGESGTFLLNMTPFARSRLLRVCACSRTVSVNVACDLSRNATIALRALRATKQELPRYNSISARACSRPTWAQVKPLPVPVSLTPCNCAGSPLFNRGASYGLNTRMNQVSAGAFGAQLDRIVPRLFRYRFDPSAKTRSTMEQLWRSVVAGGGGGDFSIREQEVR